MNIAQEQAREKIVEAMTKEYSKIKFKEHGGNSIIDVMQGVSEQVDSVVEQSIACVLATMYNKDTTEEIEKRLGQADIEVNDDSVESTRMSVAMSVVLSIGASLQLELTRVLIDNTASAMLASGSDYDKIRDGVDKAFDEALTRGKQIGMRKVDNTIMTLA